MELSTYIILSGILFIFRIIITIYCVNKAGELNRNKWGWGLFGFFIPLLALIWILSIKRIKANNYGELCFNNDINTNQDDLQNEEEDISNSFFDKRLNLLDLKEGNDLSEEEFNEKSAILNIQKQELLKKIEEKRIKRQVEERIEPKIIKFEQLKKDNLLTDEDFEKKKKKLFIDKMEQLRNNPIKPCGIIKYNQLNNFQKGGVRDFIKKSNGENIILYNRTTEIICSCSQQEFYELEMSDEINDYLIVKE